jgi:uncharacterized protein (TIGR02996 family)
MAGTLIEVLRGPDASARFQVLEVGKDTPIKAFVEASGLTFAAGRGCYELTGPETVQGHKEIIVLLGETGEAVAGARARELLAAPAGAGARLRPEAGRKVFVQSSSSNRKLAKGTTLLYRVEDWGPRRAAPTGAGGALAQAVLDDPGDDAVRRVYADWCEENGQAERAEFIRLQLDQGRLEEWARHLPMEKLPEGTDQPEARAQEILRRRAPGARPWGERWLTALPAPLRTGVTWRRGFPEIDLQDSAQLGAFLDRLAGPETERPPVALRIRLSHGEERLRELARNPPANLPPVVELDLGFSSYEHYLDDLLTAPWLGGVVSLCLGFTYVDDGGARALAACALLSRLRVLSFWALHCDEGLSTRMGPEGVAALADSPHLTGLRDLDLGQTRVLDEGLRALAEGPTLTRLTRLDLFDAQVTDEGVRALASSPGARSLRCLDLMGQNRLTDAALRALAGSPHLGNLESLSLGGHGYSDSDFDSAEGAPPARFTPAGWRALCDSPRLKRLAWLHLDEYDGAEQGEASAALLRARFGKGLLHDRWC